jgi:phospholipase/carboxylesterase
MSLTGPSVAAQSGTTDSLVIFCHGFGADGQDLIGFASLLQESLPNTAFVAPNAPERCEMGGMGYQWFGISEREVDGLTSGVDHAAPLLNAYIDEQLALYGLDESRLALIGFSQGTIMSLHVGLRRKLAPACIIGYSGTIIGKGPLTGITCHPPILLVHGDADEVLPVEQMHRAVSLLQEAGLDVEFYVSPGLGHGIDQAGFELGSQFLREALP